MMLRTRARATRMGSERMARRKGIVMRAKRNSRARPRRRQLKMRARRRTRWMPKKKPRDLGVLETQEGHQSPRLRSMR